MSLGSYRHKRDFGRTAEPEGEGQGKHRGRERMFVVQRHEARRLHYDLRLELDGVLKSWAIPKGPSENPSERRLAIQVEDHPLEYGSFEGVIPEGEYGAGLVMLWDRGTWEAEKGEDPAKALKAGSIKFTLNGQKLRGRWALVKTKSGENHWLLFRHGVEEEEVATLPAPASFKVALATPVEVPPAGDEWLHEVKYDGYRMLAWKQGDLVRLLSRNGKDWTRRFALIVEEMRRIPEDFVLDGEMVVLEPGGKSSFQLLQRSLQGEGAGELVYYVFDVLLRGPQDLRGQTLLQRKSVLEEILREAPLSNGSRIRFSDHLVGEGPTFFRYVCEAGLEGVVSKRAGSHYHGRRTRDWQKAKCLRRQEFVVGGFTKPGGSRAGFGALLLGYSGPDGKLRYAGRAGSGFGEAQLKSLRVTLDGLVRESSPFADPLPAGQERGGTWVEPRLVVEVRFTEWTGEGILRHPVFLGLREDKDPSEVGLEPVGTNRSGKTKERNTPMQVAGIEITHPERPVFPDAQISKGEVAEYYWRIAPIMLPYIENRPISVVRCPEGRHRSCFFQKHWAAGMLPQIGTVPVKEEGGQTTEYLSVGSAEGLVALAQFGMLEIHPWLSRRDRLDQPDMMVFDLDPGEGVRWDEVLGAALMMRHQLEAVDLQSFVKRTGGKGLHLVVPIRRGPHFAVVRAAAKALAEKVRQESPGQLLTVANKAKRIGKIYIDYLRNGRGATAVAPYSLRAREGAPVACPEKWDVLLPLHEPELVWMRSVLSWIEKGEEDPWRDYFQTRQSLKKSVLSDLGVGS